MVDLSYEELKNLLKAEIKSELEAEAEAEQDIEFKEKEINDQKQYNNR